MIRASSHPLVRHKLARLRETSAGPAEFRRLVRELSALLAYEATADLPTQPVTVTTPLCDMVGQKLADTIGIVPILRAGLGMADGVLDLIPEAEVWHIGLYRDEATLRPMEYYNKLPAGSRITVALVVDPMLATGGSAIRTCEVVRQAGIANVRLLSLIAAPEGMARMNEAFPDIPVFVGAVDERLNDRGYIVPGLGDAGDRQFGTL